MKKGIRSIKRGLAVLLSACMVFGMTPIQAGAEEAGTTLKQAGLTLPKYWEDRMVKAVRKVLLFDVERKKLCAWMDSEHIWHLPLKGIIMKDYYPSVGMRQMSDNDILFDADAWERMEKHMISEGYKAEYVGKGNHDVYHKLRLQAL